MIGEKQQLHSELSDICAAGNNMYCDYSVNFSLQAENMGYGFRIVKVFIYKGMQDPYEEYTHSLCDILNIYAPNAESVIFYGAYDPWDKTESQFGSILCPGITINVDGEVICRRKNKFTKRLEKALLVYFGDVIGDMD